MEHEAEALRQRLHSLQQGGAREAQALAEKWGEGGDETTCVKHAYVDVAWIESDCLATYIDKQNSEASPHP